MEYLKKDELYKNRSYANCISSGYRVMVDNYKSIFAHTWKAALAYCIVNFVALFITNSFSIPSDATGWVIWGVMCAAVISSHYYFYANIVNVFTQYGKMSAFRKLMNIFMFALAASVLVLLLTYTASFLLYRAGCSNIIISAVFAVIMILLFVLSIPFGYVFIKYLSEEDNHFFTTIKKHYSTGFGHWGLIFITFILSMLFIMGVSLFIAIPFYILIIAKFLSDTGTILGDPSGMPAYFSYTYAFTASLIMVVLTYLYTYVFSTLYYTYGSIEQRENEKRGFIEDSKRI